jgi:predicted protein tyrosine phosphatase
MPSHTKHYLFICSINQSRSITAEHICNQLAKATNKDIECESAGIHPMSAKGVNKNMADRADLIFVMEDYMKETLMTEFHQPAEKIICMDIPDICYVGDPELEATIRQKLLPYI